MSTFSPAFSIFSVNSLDTTQNESPSQSSDNPDSQFNDPSSARCSSRSSGNKNIATGDDANNKRGRRQRTHFTSQQLALSPQSQLSRRIDIACHCRSPAHLLYIPLQLHSIHYFQSFLTLIVNYIIIGLEICWILYC